MSALTCVALRGALRAVAEAERVRLSLEPGRLVVEGASPYLLVSLSLPAPEQCRSAQVALEPDALARLVSGLPPTSRVVGGLEATATHLRLRASGRSLAVPARPADDLVWAQVDALGNLEEVDGAGIWDAAHLEVVFRAVSAMGGVGVVLDQVGDATRVLVRARATCPVGEVRALARPYRGGHEHTESATNP